MAISTNCCMKFKPPTSSPSPPTSSPSPPRGRNSSWMTAEESLKRSKLRSRVASIVIGLEMANLVLAFTQNNSSPVVLAGDQPLAMESSSKVLRRKWSEKRVCPSWHLNSLENIVPENLPRPSAKRRFEAVAYDDDAPSVKFVAKYVTSKCFTM